MKRIPLLTTILLLAALAAGATAARADGAWTTYIRALGFTDVEAGLDSVWFASGNAGLLLYDRSSGELSSITRSFGGLSSNAVSALALDRSRRLWVGTFGGGVSRLVNDGSSGGRWALVNVFDGLPSDSVTVLKAYGDTVWIGTPAGIAFWKGTEISGVLPDGVNPSPFASDRVSGIVMMGDSLWVSTAGGVYLGRMSQELSTWTAANENLVTTDVRGLAAAGARLFAVAGSTVWVRDATQWSSFGGLGAVFRIAEDHGVVLASTDSGLWRWNGSGWTLETATPISTGASMPTRVTAAAADPLGRVSLANLGTMQPVDAGGTRTTLVSPGPVGNNVTNVLDDGRSVYVTSTSQGLSRLRDGAWTLWPGSLACDTCTTAPYGLSSSFGLMIDRSGLKWFSNWDHALTILDDRGPHDIFTNLWIGGGYDIDSHTWALAMAVDSAGGRWVGSDTPCADCPKSDGKAPRGLDYYAPGEPVTTASYRRTYSADSSADGLLGNQARTLAVQGDRLWVGFLPSNGNAGANSIGIPATPGEDLVTVRTLNFRFDTEVSKQVFGVATYGDSIWVLSADSLRCFRNNGVDGSPITLANLGPMLTDATHPLEVTPDGSVWTACNGGVRVYHPGGASQDFTIGDSPLAGDQVRAVRLGSDRRSLWFVTSEGFNRYDPGYVAPPAPELSRLTVRVWPNPMDLSALGGTLRLSGDGQAYRGAVYAIDGRRVRAVSVDGNGAVVWDGRDDRGHVVPAGVYLLRVEAGGAAATARVVVLR